jgi:antitoxin (DNA-binding transcriptional repressor) of toxin-antitoxin stability system
MQNIGQKIVGLKELWQNIGTYIKAVKSGQSFIVVRKSKPVCKISLPDSEEIWETVIDFTKIKKGGVSVDEILPRL